jgi:ATP-dependent helicase HrpB
VVRLGHDEEADEEAILQVLMQKALTDIDGLLPPELIHRARYAGIGELSADRLPQTADLWLAPMLRGRRDLLVGAGRAGEAVLGMLDWPTRQRLDHDAPCEFVSPAGTRHIIDYSGPDAPSTQVRVQAMFGLDTHPMIGKTPLLLKLTSPAGSPVQATRDLPAFWRGSWSDVRKDMKGRYPKHRWPEEPWTEAPSLKTKNAFSRASD